jgi:cobalt-zinc-cadmium efflux system protein
MAHNHSHGHSESGDIKVAFLLNASFTLIELVGGLLTNSIAVLSDSLHDLGDSISLGLAWFLARYAQKGSDRRYSYGYRRFSLLGALINAVILIVGSLFILSEAMRRLADPEPFQAGGIVGIAILGIVVNGAATLRLKESGSANAQVVRWHLLEDVLGWVAVLVVGLVSLFIDLPILDPILSILITIYVLANVIIRLKSVAELFMQAVPSGIDINAITAKLEAIPGVKSTHHVHLWSLDGERNVLTAHIVISKNCDKQENLRIKQDVLTALEDLDLHLEHMTLELEYEDEIASMRNTEDASRFHR